MRTLLITSALTGTALLDLSGVYAQLASMASTVALWAGKRANPEGDPAEELAKLTERLRHPSPLDRAVSFRKKLDRRRASVE